MGNERGDVIGIPGFHFGAKPFAIDFPIKIDRADEKGLLVGQMPLVEGNVLVGRVAVTDDPQFTNPFGPERRQAAHGGVAVFVIRRGLAAGIGAVEHP